MLNRVRLRRGTASIELAGGLQALVDEADLPLLDGRRWVPMEGRQTFYVYANRPKIYLHRVILGAGPGERVDHRDRDGLNNRRANLRVATLSQNGGNMAPRNGPGSFKGIRRTRSGKWQALIGIDNRRYHLGVYPTPEEAARIYDAAAREAWGEYARLNFPVSA